MSTIPDGTKVIRASGTRPSKSSSKVLRHTWEFDFTGCSLAEVLSGFVTSEVIRRQGLIRADVKAGRVLRYPEGVVTVEVAKELRAPRAVVQAPMTLDSVKAFATSSPENAEAVRKMILDMQAAVGEADALEDDENEDADTE